MSTYTRILVPIDASDLTDKVVDTALATAAWSGAEVVLLHVVPKGADLSEHADTASDLDALERQTASLIEMAKARQAALAALDSMPPVRAEVRSGDVVEAIASAVEDTLCDLVVMGTHGRSGLLEQFTGSTTERVMARVPATVFVVRPTGYPYLRD